MALTVALGFNPSDCLTEWRGILSLQKTSEDPKHSVHSAIVCFLLSHALGWISHGLLASTGQSTSAWLFRPQTHMTGHVWASAFTLMTRTVKKKCFSEERAYLNVPEGKTKSNTILYDEETDCHSSAHSFLLLPHHFTQETKVGSWEVGVAASCPCLLDQSKPAKATKTVQ